MAEDTAHAAERASLKERAAEELKAFFYITLYFWIFALVFELVRAMALKSEGIGIVSQGFAIVNALVLAKVALIMEAFYKKRLLRDTRLIYQVITHALLLALILIAFSLLEEGIKALLHHQSIASHFTSADVTFILAKGAVFFVTLLPFCAFQELARLLGGRQLAEVFLEPHAESPYILVREADIRAK